MKRIWGRLPKKGQIFCCGVGLLGLIAVSAQASVVDAPHNDSNGITCTSCHTYSFWWRYSPAQKQTDFPTLVDTLCFDCHKDGGSGPKVMTHSSTVIGSSTYGTWGKACTECHNPHYQGQLQWAGSASTPYLVSGTMAGVSYDSVNKETTIIYADTITNVGWPAVGASPESKDWANKSSVIAGRGLILVQDTVKTTNTFSIISATETEVTVKGEITADMINPDYIDPVTHMKNSATAASFGLIYGNLIRDSINSRPVKFFDPNGGFVRDEGTATTGICQVCHTQTLHYANSGAMPDSTDSHFGRDGMNCTICHQHLIGFKGLGHDAQSFSWAGNCATCHNPSGAAVNITDVIHGKKCGLCHVDPGGGGARMDGDPLSGIDGSALDATNASTCVDCHLTKLSLIGGTIHHVSPSGFAAAGNCIECHADASGKLVAPHNILVAGDADCASCHTATAGLATGMPVNTSDNKVHNACLSCHNTDGSLQAPHGYASAIPQGGGSCKTCHGAGYFDLHQKKNDHVGQVDKAVDNCTSVCHFHDKADTIVDIHQNNCGHCHDMANGGVKISLAAQYGPGDCTNCHRDIAEDPMTHPRAMSHVGQVDREPTCLNTAGCHSGSAMQVHQNNCSNCHAWNWGLRTNFNPAIASANTPGNCTGCHTQSVIDGHSQDLGKALDAPGLIWQTSPNGAWTPTCFEPQFGVGSAQSVAAPVASWLQTSIVGPGTLSFWWKLTTGTDTMLQFSVDGVTATPDLVSVYDWQLVTVPITGAGTHVVQWTHAHPFIGSDGPGFVDHVVWSPNVP